MAKFLATSHNKLETVSQFCFASERRLCVRMPVQPFKRKTMCTILQEYGCLVQKLLAIWCIQFHDCDRAQRGNEAVAINTEWNKTGFPFVNAEALNSLLCYI